VQVCMKLLCTLRHGNISQLQHPLLPVVHHLKDAQINAITAREINSIKPCGVCGTL
jgi:hypothetical protein